MNIGSTGRIPGPLNLATSSGLGIYAQAAKVVKTVVRKTVAREVGERVAELGLKKAGSRLAGKLFLNSKPWVKAFEHIAEHFSLKAAAAKASHTLFVTSLRNKSAVEGLIKKALKAPTKKYLSRLTVSGQAVGRPCVVIEKEFAEVIGETFEKVGAEFVKKEGGDAKWLRIVVDITGRPITAFPFKP